MIKSSGRAASAATDCTLLWKRRFVTLFMSIIIRHRSSVATGVQQQRAQLHKTGSVHPAASFASQQASFRVGAPRLIHLTQFNARGGSSLQACLQLLLDNANLNNRRSPKAQPLKQERTLFVQEEGGPHPKGHVPAAKIRSKKLKASLTRKSPSHLMMALASAATAIVLK